jgi:hypothetical protein
MVKTYSKRGGETTRHLKRLSLKVFITRCPILCSYSHAILSRRREQAENHVPSPVSHHGASNKMAAPLELYGFIVEIELY